MIFHQDDDRNPRIMARQCGGWLAVSPAGDSLQVGVVAASEDEARDLLQRTMARWREILETGRRGDNAVTAL